MQELSMNVLDIVENSINAGASLTSIMLDYKDDGRLILTIEDDGCGMDSSTVERVVNPFYTTRTTRKIGLGLPFLKMAAEMTGGTITVDSELGRGTVVTAFFFADHIDMMPLGDMGSTMSALISGNPETDFIYILRNSGKSFTLDSKEIKVVLEGVPVESPQVALFIKEYTEENSNPVLGGRK